MVLSYPNPLLQMQASVSESLLSDSVTMRVSRQQLCGAPPQAFCALLPVLLLPLIAPVGLPRASRTPAQPHPALFDPADLDCRTTAAAACIAAVTMAACTSLTAALTSQHCSTDLEGHATVIAATSLCCHSSCLQVQLRATLTGCCCFCRPGGAPDHHCCHQPAQCH